MIRMTMEHHSLRTANQKKHLGNEVKSIFQGTCSAVKVCSASLVGERRFTLGKHLLSLAVSAMQGLEKDRVEH